MFWKSLYQVDLNKRTVKHLIYFIVIHYTVEICVTSTSGTESPRFNFNFKLFVNLWIWKIMFNKNARRFMFYVSIFKIWAQMHRNLSAKHSSQRVSWKPCIDSCHVKICIYLHNSLMNLVLKWNIWIYFCQFQRTPNYIVFALVNVNQLIYWQEIWANST